VEESRNRSMHCYLGSRCGLVVSLMLWQFHPSWKSCRYSIERGWVGSRAGLGHREWGEICHSSVTNRSFIPGAFGLQRSCRIDWATPIHDNYRRKEGGKEWERNGSGQRSRNHTIIHVRTSNWITCSDTSNERENVACSQTRAGPHTSKHGRCI
jgi:hypothetical protein